MRLWLSAIAAALLVVTLARGAVATGPAGGGGGGSFTNLPLLTNIVTGVVSGNYIARDAGTGTNTALTTGTNFTKTVWRGSQTNSMTVWTNGGLWFQTAQWDTSLNPYGGGLNWVGQGANIPFNSSGTPMASIRAWDNWGGSASSATSPWLLVTAPNVRLEQGYGAGYGDLVLGNEDAAGVVNINWNRGPTLAEYDAANSKLWSQPLFFNAVANDASANHVHSGSAIAGYAPDYAANSNPNSGLRQGELWFYSLGPYRVNGGYAQNGQNTFRSNVVFRMLTNSVVFDGTIGIGGTSKTYINGGSITNTDMLTKIVGTDSNGKMVGATLSGLSWDGTTLTSSGGSSFWNTNATDGTITNINGGGVSVGTGFIATTNGGAIINANKTPGMLRVLNNGVSTVIDSNTISTDIWTNRTASGSYITNNNTGSWGFNAAPVAGAAINAGAAIRSTGGFNSQSTLDASVGNGSILTAGGLYVAKKIITSGGVLLATNGIPANPVAGHSYSTNGSSDITIGTFASVPNDSITETSFSVSNSGTASILVTFSGGTRGPDNSLPAKFYVSPASEAVFAAMHNAQRSTNVVRKYWTNALEEVSSKVKESSPVTLSTSGVAQNVTSISLLPGVWDVSANINGQAAVAVTVLMAGGGISTTSATIPTDGTEVRCGASSAGLYFGMTVPTKRLNLTTTTTVYLPVLASWAGGTSQTVWGSISARRVQ